ncbi:adaptor protein MecA [Pradoshia sp. D12]|uniref:adaptor protein MecA n=1 Tax=Bacillaceae TaxID=186817 RepID=UPI00080AF5CA|nr:MULTISPECIES: adaptor protein MecA [Bacillaceae]OCA89964.1 adaptor protein MecA [Bacillus sp. FJAT-27986]QFK70632.1 adaptor protein MecA [Pradoshia sp. D12]TPF72427.1 adaptor protein MecA [Bacillus sp. D12]
MEIERINENTVKFYISYGDIEKRGFDREEIWYNRDRSEELFWEMMDEVHEEEDFTVEGPLWIQIQALEKGLEILVTRAHLSKDGHKFDLPIDDPANSVDVKIESMLEEHFQTNQAIDEQITEDDTLEFVLSFKDFEDVIALSKTNGIQGVVTKLYSFENIYYLYVEFPDGEFVEEEIDNKLSIILEYADESPVTIHRLEEYGKVIIPKDVFSTVSQYFS